MRIPVIAASKGAAAGVAAVLLGAVLLGAGPPGAWTTSAGLDLGAAARFAVLAGDGVSDTGPSVISGDVGTYPRMAIPDLLDREATGLVDRAGSSSQQAQLDLATAIASAATLPRDGTLSLAVGRTVAPGVYSVVNGTQGPAANLTLDRQGAAAPVWIFVVANDLVTAPDTTMTLVNGAQACNVFWVVGGSATLASGSTFAGSILASGSVKVHRDVTIAGRLLARSGPVSLGGARIATPTCPLNIVTTPQQPVAAGGLLPSFHSPASVAGPPSPVTAFLPIVMLVLLVAAVILAEPRHRHRRVARGGW